MFELECFINDVVICIKQKFQQLALMLQKLIAEIILWVGFNIVSFKIIRSHDLLLFCNKYI